MKKKYLLIFTVLFMVLALFGCQKNNKATGGKSETFDKDASYAIGMNIGQSLIADGIIPNMDEFFLGLKDAFAGGETRFTEYEAIEKIQTAYMAMMERMEAEEMERGSEAAQAGTDFLVKNSSEPGVIMTRSGLQYMVIHESEGPKPAVTDVVRVNYEGRLIDGAVFDSSYNRGFPAEFPLNRVIPGWTEGLQLMGVGSRYRFFIPQELGYGSRPPQGSVIPPYSVLIFDVELLEILDDDDPFNIFN